MVPTTLKRSGVLIAVLALVLAGFAGAGTAGTKATQTCDPATATRPFTPWLDVAAYVLAPGGTLEGGSSGWTLSGGAKAVSGNEPYYVHGKGESRSLLLPAGSSATTGPMCIGLLHPTIRFFAVSSGSSLSTLRVQVLFLNNLKLLSAVDGGVVTASASWRPTLPILMLANFTAPLGTNSVAFRFTPVGSASWQVDDVYVDPWVSR